MCYNVSCVKWTVKRLKRRNDFEKKRTMEKNWHCTDNYMSRIFLLCFVYVYVWCCCYKLVFFRRVKRSKMYVDELFLMRKMDRQQTVQTRSKCRQCHANKNNWQFSIQLDSITLQPEKCTPCLDGRHSDIYMNVHHFPRMTKIFIRHSKALVSVFFPFICVNRELFHASKIFMQLL